MSVKKSFQLTLRDLLSRLTLPQAAKWLGTDGGRLLREAGGDGLELSPEHASWLGENSFQLIIPRAVEPPVVVTLKRDPAGRDGVAWACSEREQPLPWVAETLGFVLEEKSSLGLAEAPPETHALPVELLDEQALVERALGDREKRAVAEKMVITQAVKPAQGPWTDYLVQKPSFRSHLAGRLPGNGPGKLLLRLPRLPQKHPRHLQACHEGHGLGEEAVSRP